MERCHNSAACAHDMALAQCEEEAGARRSAENLAEERKEQTENEQRLRVDAASELRGGARTQATRGRRNARNASGAGSRREAEACG